ncbi:hypothetical protein Tco_0898023, partial [Tanacetum coccineum]
VKYKGLKAEIVILANKIDAMNKGESEKGLVVELYNWDEESVSSDDEGVTMSHLQTGLDGIRVRRRDFIEHLKYKA